MSEQEDFRLEAVALKALQRIYSDEEASFKSREQGEAVLVALQRRSDVLAILRTGGGKSLVFQLPASVESGLTTVVIVPFVALMEEMKGRCLGIGLSSCIWGVDGVTFPTSVQGLGIKSLLLCTENRAYRVNRADAPTE